MTGHRQEMFTIELTVGEIQEAVERRILEKYKFLTKEDGWECQEIGFHEKNLNGVEPNFKGASGFYIKELIVEEDAPVKEKCEGGCGKCLNSCR
jgi:hypothetical protein